MQITKIRPVNEKKVFIETDEKEGFCLYLGEVKKLGILCGMELSAEDYRHIREEILVKRAKKRALYLLNFGRKTEDQLKRKLIQDRYPKDVAREAVEYAKSFGYLDDAAFARDYIELNKDRKSKREMALALFQKGLSKEEIRQAMEEVYDQEDHVNAIRRILHQKGYDPREKDEKKRQKIIGYLARKGFSWREVQRQMELEEEEIRSEW
ncbi:regulatory protein RecX, partial [Suipraeoptans intestinalis]|uniref:regulatory protein RecX n=1 Tax=Suipraeoptans intestinalis TaxID=2606628 RepID=UPI0023F293B8